MRVLTESEYDWAIIPEDLPRENLVLITAKTPHPTYHAEDIKRPVRLFTQQELLEAARSLAHRPIGLNHLGIVPRAFTVDAQYNPSTLNVEALCYFPDEWIGTVKKLLNEGKESIFSVEYTWRDTKDTEEGVEFVGLIFDKVDLLCGLGAGDKAVTARLVEADVSLSKYWSNSYLDPIPIEMIDIPHRKGLCEADAGFLEPHKPEQIQEQNISQANENPSQDFFKECATEADCYLESLKHEPKDEKEKKLRESINDLIKKERMEMYLNGSL